MKKRKPKPSPKKRKPSIPPVRSVPRKPRKPSDNSNPEFESFVKFETPRTLGIHIRYKFKRLYPLYDKDINKIKKVVAELFDKHVRQPYHFAILMTELSVLGGFYEVRWGLPKEDEEPKWLHQWISTPVCAGIESLLEEIDYLYNEVIERQLQNRPCWVIRFQLTCLSNVTNPPKR